ncbi:response regulator [Photobacterium nomapromontoriensis]|uniref:response regulator n=1 Tax=Photobacterium nomapromontoriensis TaxID=2910237 RepID=UPI003D0DAB11
MDILTQSTFLIIDDSNIIQSATRALLMKIGVPMNNIISTSNARGAITACGKRHFDILLIDHNLGSGSTGLQLLEYLHDQQLLQQRTLVFIVTANDSQDVFFGYSQLEPDGYLIKPIRSEDIIKRVSSGLLKRAFCEQLETAFNTGGLAKVKPLFGKAPDTMALKYGILFVADLLRAQQQFDDAQAMLTGLLQVHDFLPAKIKRVEIQNDQGQCATALTQISELIEQNPYNVRLLTLKATICIESECWEEAEQTFLQILQLHPSNIEQTLNLAWLYILKNDVVQATPLLFKSALMLPHSVWDGAGRRGMVLFADLVTLKHQDEEQALKNWKPDGAWARICKNPQSRINSKGILKTLLGWRALLIGNHQQALALFNQVNETEIIDYEAGYLLFRGYLQLEHTDGTQATRQIIDTIQRSTAPTLSRLQAAAVTTLKPQPLLTQPVSS